MSNKSKLTNNQKFLSNNISNTENITNNKNNYIFFGYTATPDKNVSTNIDCEIPGDPSANNSSTDVVIESKTDVAIESNTYTIENYTSSSITYDETSYKSFEDNTNVITATGGEFIDKQYCLSITKNNNIIINPENDISVVSDSTWCNFTKFQSLSDYSSTYNFDNLNQYAYPIFNIDSNTSKNDRTCTITFKAKNEGTTNSLSYKITQPGKKININVYFGTHDTLTDSSISFDLYCILYPGQEYIDSLSKQTYKKSGDLSQSIFVDTFDATPKTEGKGSYYRFGIHNYSCNGHFGDITKYMTLYKINTLLDNFNGIANNESEYNNFITNNCTQVTVDTSYYKGTQMALPQEHRGPNKYYIEFSKVDGTTPSTKKTYTIWYGYNGVSSAYSFYMEVYPSIYTGSVTHFTKLHNIGRGGASVGYSIFKVNLEIDTTTESADTFKGLSIKDVLLDSITKTSFNVRGYKLSSSVSSFANTGASNQAVYNKFKSDYCSTVYTSETLTVNGVSCKSISLKSDSGDLNNLFFEFY